MKTIRITTAFLERAAAKKSKCSATIRRGNTYAIVSYREWEDHYHIYSRGATWLCSFTDSSMRGQSRFENVSTAKDIRVSFPS